jgi:hypothetical protein
MRLSTLSAVAAMAGSSLAGPLVEPRQAKVCMTEAEAKEIVDVYARLIANYQPADCEKYCADNFADNSDSINSFLNQPLGQPTFATKKIFMEAQLVNPPFPLVVDSVDAVACEAIGLRWHATFGEAMKPSKGITILKTTKEKGWWQITELNVEFNSLMWLLNMGGNYTWNG